MILEFNDVQINVENEGKAGWFQILPIFKKLLKANVKPEDFKF